MSLHRQGEREQGEGGAGGRYKSPNKINGNRVQSDSQIESIHKLRQRSLVLGFVVHTKSLQNRSHADCNSEYASEQREPEHLPEDVQARRAIAVEGDIRSGRGGSCLSRSTSRKVCTVGPDRPRLVNKGTVRGRAKALSAYGIPERRAAVGGNPESQG